MFQNSKKAAPAETKRKTEYYLTATLLSPLRPGKCAVYIYNGNVIRTSRVQTILEAAADYVQFETQNSIYTLGHIRTDTENALRCA